MTDLVLQSRQDSSYFNEERVDNAIKGQMEGGYTSTRPRYTRAPLYRFKTGFTDLSEAEVETLDGFFNTYSTYSSFTYTHPITGVIYTVRFSQPYTKKYVGGKPGTSFWTITDVVLDQV